jgi:hypothetical protein
MLDAFETELKAATVRVAKRATSEFASGDVYGFALFTSGDFQYVTVCVFTQPGLRAVTQKYFDKNHYFREWDGNFERGMRELRWSPCDSPGHLFAEDEFERAGVLLDELWAEIFKLPDTDEDDGPFEKLCGSIEVCMLRALEELRRTKILPETVVLCLMMGDQSDEQRLAYAERLNAPGVAEQFRGELGELDNERLKRWRERLPDN